MKYTNIKITKNNFDKLNEIRNGTGTMDSTINKIMDQVDSFMPLVNYSTDLSSIKLSTETLERIDTFHISNTESRNNIITRLLIAFDELNNTSSEIVDEYISFKLINPYNDLLVLEGQIEYNSKVITFNHRGYVYLGKLPKSYIVDGKDLTKELYIWYDNLDWNEITNLLLKNVDEQTIIEDKDFILEINNVMG